jgi:hypothetical protein
MDLASACARTLSDAGTSSMRMWPSAKRQTRMFLMNLRLALEDGLHVLLDLLDVRPTKSKVMKVRSCRSRFPGVWSRWRAGRLAAGSRGAQGLAVVVDETLPLSG